MTEQYMKTMEDYSPNSSGTEYQSIEEVIEIEGVPQLTGISDASSSLVLPKYMAPKAIEVKRYTLKK